jgi:hypothetical protein
MKIVQATRRGLGDTACVVLVLAAAATAGVLLPGVPVAVRTAAAAVLLLAPGVLAVRLALRGGGLAADALLWATAASIALVVLLGLVLDRLPGGIHRASWVAGLDVLAVLLALACRRVRWRVAPGSRSETRSRRPAVLAARAVVLALAVAIAAAAVTMNLHGARTEARRQEFAQVWLLPSGSRHVLIGVRSGRSVPTTYRLTLLADGRVMRTWGAIRLRWGEQWQRRAPVPPSLGTGSRLVARVVAPANTVPAEHARLFWVS